MRHLFRPEATPDSDRFDRATRTVVVVNALLGSVASLVALFSHTAGALPRELLLVLSIVLVVAPRLLRDRVAMDGRGVRPAPRSLVVGVVLAQVFGVGLIASLAPVALLPASLLAIQGHLVRRAAVDLAASGSLALGASQGLVAFVFAPRAVTLLAFLLGFMSAIVGGALVHGRASRRHVQRVVESTALAPPDRGSLGARVRYGVTLSLVALVCALFLDGTARGISRWWTSMQEPGIAGGMERREQGPLGAPAAGGAPRAGEEDATQSFAASLDYDQPFVGSGDQLLARAKPIRGLRPGAGMYLRGVVFDTFTPTGLRTSRGAGSKTIQDADDGIVDGWAVLDATRPAPREAAIEQVPIRFGQAGGGTVLLTLEPAQAVDVAPVAYDPDRVLEDLATRQDWFTYRLRAGPVPPRAMLGGTVATHPDARYTDHPGRGPTAARLESLGESLTASAESDLARVDAVVRYFSDGFAYKTETPTGQGIEALDSLLDDRSGYCVQYASAAALMLRMQGVPARVVQGFHATEWVAVESLYDVYPPDVHAWIEVFFKGYGWVPFDPTPADERLAALRDPLGGEDANRWADDASQLLGAWLDGRNVTLDDLARLLARGPGSLVRTFGRGPLLIAALVLVAFGIWLVMPSRRRAARPLDADERVRLEAAEHYGRILHELARLGHRKRISQTPREFARTVVQTRDELLEALGPLTERLYAARFGTRPLSAADVASIDSFVAALRGRQRVVR